MAIPLDLVLGDVGDHATIERLVRHRLDRIGVLHDRAVSCHVRVDAPHAAQRNGRLVEVRIELVVPGETLAVGEHGGRTPAHEEAHVALRDAFDALERQLERWKERRRDEVKTHAGERGRAGALLGAEADRAREAAGHGHGPDEPDTR